jgi:hypothetical protein
MYILQSSSVILIVLNWRFSGRDVGGLRRSSKIFHISAGSRLPSTYVMTDRLIVDVISLATFFVFFVHVFNCISYSRVAVECA